ncbi:MAG TPA: hypothetical protein DCQ83_06930 [Fibrobacteres bacterium]|jgi:starch synthase|nr:hypothetical protein [Fibrobacterota bacterium]
MKVLYIAAECKPFSKTGGVGDVAGELPVALKQQGVDIEIVTPWYGSITLPGADIPFNGRAERAGIVTTDVKGVPVNFIRNSAYFETDYSRGLVRPPFENPDLFKKDYSRPYVDSGKIPFYDDALRFSFFSEACLELIRRKKPDVVHINDWVLGYLFGYMALEKMPQKRVLTIHNIGYQGNIGRESIKGWNIERIAKHKSVGKLFADPRPKWKSVNALRLAMELADQVNTVSPTYKREMTEAENPARYFEGGKGLEKVSQRLDDAGKLHGILNGFEYKSDPTDAAFEKLIAEKSKTKKSLSRGFAKPKGLLLGFVGRAVEQKFKLLKESLDGKCVLEHILEIPNVNIALVATGMKEYEDFLHGFVGRSNFSATLEFAPGKAQEISLGADVFLMPSLFEPCGITQMESLSCATPPLVRWTGGLVDTVKPHTDPKGTGFGFDGRTAREVLENLVQAVKAAERMYREQPEKFLDMQKRGFKQRFLWSTAAKEYVAKLYRSR